VRSGRNREFIVSLLMIQFKASVTGVRPVEHTVWWFILVWFLTWRFGGPFLIAKFNGHQKLSINTLTNMNCNSQLKF
jgi:hypothetical protein